MIEAKTSKPLRVSNIGTAGPFIDLPESQLDEVRKLLDRHGVYYWVSESVISLNGGPAMAEINLGRRGNAELVQGILDGGL